MLHSACPAIEPLDEDTALSLDQVDTARGLVALTGEQALSRRVELATASPLVQLDGDTLFVIGGVKLETVFG